MHLYFYIYIITYIYIKCFFVYRYVLFYRHGRRGKVQEQAGCVQVHLFIKCVFYMYIHSLYHCLYHYNECTSDQRGVPVSGEWREASSGLLSLSLAWRRFCGQGWKQPVKWASPVWVRPSTRRPKRDTPHAGAVCQLPLLESQGA